MTACSNLDLRVFRPGDEVAILALFNRVFARSNPDFRPRSADTWRRLFADNPDGHRIALALDDEGAVVAQYAGLGRRVRVRGEDLFGSLSVDSVVDPATRHGLGRQGPFVSAGKLYAAHFGGRAPDQDALMWGLPERSAWRIGHRYLGYDTVCNVKWLVQELPPEPAPEAPADTPGGLEVVEATSFPAQLDALFERAAEGRGALSLRDARRLTWRFGAGERVRIAIARGAHGASGYVVARPGEVDGQRGLLLCDWLVPRSEPAAARALQSWVRRTTRRLGLARAVCAFAETAPEWLDFQHAGWRVRPSRFRLVARCYRPDLSVDWLRRHWYWTLADTDLV